MVEVWVLWVPLYISNCTWVDNVGGGGMCSMGASLYLQSHWGDHVSGGGMYSMSANYIFTIVLSW